MNRRDFIKHSAAALAMTRVPAYAAQLADTRKRVGLIGTGWYGKADLLRAPSNAQLFRSEVQRVVQLRESITSRLDDAEWDRAWAEGRRIPLEDAIALALERFPETATAGV